MDSAACAGDAIPHHPMNSRNQIRQRMRRQRRELSRRKRNQAATELCKQLTASLLFLRSQRIACYLSCKGEMDLQPVMHRIFQMKKTCYLPVIHGFSQNRLDFVQHAKDEAMVNNRFNIPEPEKRLCPAPPWALDLLLLPLTAFDNKGNRLGMGGGYYDRTLAYLRQRKQWLTPVLLGVAYDFQQVEALASQPWDIPLDGVVTESAIRFFRKPGVCPGSRAACCRENSHQAYIKRNYSA